MGGKNTHRISTSNENTLVNGYHRIISRFKESQKQSS